MNIVVIIFNLKPLISHVNMSGFDEPESERGGGDISDLYAVPFKKGKGKGVSVF